MADPVSITGLVLQIGNLVKQLYDYGKAVSHAKKDIIGLCSELSALKSVLADLEAQYEYELSQVVTERLETTQYLVSGLSNELVPSTKSSTRALQSLKWPFSESQVKRTLAEIERLKSWFLLRLMTDARWDTKDVQASLSALTKAVEDDISERRLASESQDVQAIRKLLAPVPPSTTHRKCCETWSNTPSGSWLLDNEFKQWLASDHPSNAILVLTGRSGSGKTMLLSQAVERASKLVSDSEDMKLGYFYCSFSTVASQELHNVLGSWLAQIADDSYLSTHYQQYLDDFSVVRSERIEQSIYNVGGTVLLFLDAVNESNEFEKLMECLDRLCLSSKKTKIKCFVTTTPAFDFRFPHVRADMPAHRMDSDIKGYINWKIAQHRVLQSVPKEDIVNTLVSKANGMFRWVDCQITILASQRTSKMVLKALEHLPGTLNDTYVQILNRIPTSDHAIVREAMLWLCYALRPLELDELCEAVVYETGDDAIDDSCRFKPPHQLVQLCNGLIVLDESSNTVTLAHSSVRDFLTGTDIVKSSSCAFAVDETTSQHSIVHKSLSYLSMEMFRHWYDRPQRTVKWFEEYHLLRYIGRNWCLHAKRCQDELTESDFDIIDSFVLTHKQSGKRSLFAFWILCLLAEDGDFYMDDYEKDDALREVVDLAEPLYYMASSSFEAYVERMFARKMTSKTKAIGPWHIEHKCGRGFSTALQVACYRSSVRTVRALLREGANPNSTSDVSGLSCMGAAYDHGRVDIVEELRRYGGKLNSDDYELLDYRELNDEESLAPHQTVLSDENRDRIWIHGTR